MKKIFGRLTPYEREIIANVSEHGCHITVVFDPDGDEVNFAYSTGFVETVDQPEVIIFGLDPDLMHSMINSLLDQCRSGLELQDGIRVSNLLAGFDCIVREIPLSRIEPEFFNSAIWFAEHRRCAPLRRAAQIVWPSSSNGLFPWQDGVDPAVTYHQPALYAGVLNS